MVVKCFDNKTLISEIPVDWLDEITVESDGKMMVSYVNKFESFTYKTLYCTNIKCI